MHFSFRRESGILCLDLLIALFAFWLARYFGTLPRWYWLVLSAVVWVILGGVSRKLQFDSYKRIRYALLGVFTLNVFSGLSIYFLYRHFVPGYEADHSILVATGIITLLEWSLYGLLRTFVYRKIPYFYEEPLLEDVTDAGVRSENEMAVTYEKTFEIEIINELSASVYNRVLNYVLNHELNKNDSQLLEVNLLNQLKLAKRVNLFDYSLEELQAVHEYWRSMNRYSKQVLNKEKVA